MILLQEANDASSPETFREMIEQAGLTTVLIHNCKPGEYSIYYLGIMRQGETPPAWLAKSA